MLRVTEQVDTSYLEQPTPRPRPTGVMLNLFYDYMLERPLRTLLNPLSITCLVALIVLYLLRVPPLVRLIPLLILLGQLGLAARQIWRRVRDDMALLSNGLIVRAHVTRLRPHRNPTGAIEGALLDCAIQWHRAAPTWAASGFLMAMKHCGWRTRGGSRCYACHAPPAPGACSKAPLPIFATTAWGQCSLFPPTCRLPTGALLLISFT